jgi:replicative DNA helicase
MQALTVQNVPLDHAVESLKTPPFSREAEQSVLGGLMLNNEAWVSIAELLTETDFYQRQHQILFRAIKSLSEERHPCDPVTLSEWLLQYKLLDAIGGGAYLAYLAGNTPSAANIIAYALIVRERSILRQLMRVGNEMIDSAYNTQGRTSTQLLDQAEKSVFEIAELGARTQGGFVKIDKILKETVERLDKLSQLEGKITGIPTGFTDFDNETSGLQRSDLIIVAGRPSMGKCLVSDSQIALANGTLATIEEIYQSKKGLILTLGEDYHFYLTQPTDFIKDGIKPVFRVTTQLGRTIETTLTHPFLTLQGWHPLSALSVGDKIAVPRKLGLFGNETLKTCEIKLLAYLIGEPDLITHLEQPIFTPHHPKIQEDLSEAVKQFKQPVTHWLEQLGSSTAQLIQNQEIPDLIFKLPRAQLALFLNRLFAIQGWALHQNQVQVGMTCANEKQIRQVQHLLLRFGIIVSITKPVRHSPWQLELLEADAIRILSDQTDLSFLINNPCSDIINNPCRCTDLSFIITNRCYSETGDIYWDEVKAIEAIGLKPVYDLTIPDTHNFVANDICVHNTAFAMNIAQHVAITVQMPVAVFSMEMSDEQLGMRLISSVAQVNLQSVRTGNLTDDDWAKMLEAVAQLESAPLFIDQTPALTPTELRARVRRLAREQGQLALVVIDYLQLMQVPENKDNRNNEVSEISRSLKSLAKELNVPVIALSQLNRGLEQRGDKRPKMSDLRDSGSIEQDADLVVFLYRDEVYDENSPDKGIAEIIIAKQRNGPIGTTRLTFKGNITQFDNYISDDFYYGE